MFINKLSIRNFRGLDIDADGLAKRMLIFGKNDSGKTNICYAIRKVLDSKIRRIPLTEEDSTNGNRGSISIAVELDAEGISDANRSLLGPYLEDGHLLVELFADYDEKGGFYAENIRLGKTDKSNEIDAFKSNSLDRVLDLIYIEPNYDFEGSKKLFFKTKQKTAIQDRERIGQSIENTLEELNAAIQADPSFKQMGHLITSNQIEKYGFEDVQFTVESAIHVSNLYSSLDVAVYDSHSKMRIRPGDGIAKTLSMLLRKLSYEEEGKETIILVEEPENHLYPLLQAQYLSLISTFNPGQIIVTTHSPFIVNFSSADMLVKLWASKDQDGKRLQVKKAFLTEELKQELGYWMNNSFAQMLFYDRVLLVEGLSEQYFYNAMINGSQEFRDALAQSATGIFSVGGIAFRKVKRFLEELGIKVLIKTDNDIYPISRKMAGVNRCYDYLSEQGKARIREIINLKHGPIDFTLENQSLFDNNMEQICAVCEEEGIYLSNHHDGFEKDFLDFVGDTDEQGEKIRKLKEAKLINLHEYFIKHKNICYLNDTRKQSILMRPFYARDKH